MLLLEENSFQGLSSVKYINRNSTYVKKFVDRDGLPKEDPPPHANDKYLQETKEPFVAAAECKCQSSTNPV